MPNEEIKYTFTGDASGLQQASQQAIDSLKNVETAEKNINTSADFSNLTSQIQALTSSYTPLLNEINAVSNSLLISAQSCAAMSQGLVAVNFVIQQVTNNIGQLTASMQAIPLGTSEIAGALPQVSSVFAQYSDSLYNAFLMQQRGKDSAWLLTDSFNSITSAVTALIPASTSANLGLIALENSVDSLTPEAEALSGGIESISDASAHAYTDVNRTTQAHNNAANSSRKHSIALQGLKKAFSELGKPVKAVITQLAQFVSIQKITTLIRDCIEASNDWIESLNLFSVASTGYFDSMKANIDTLTYYGGAAEKTLMDAAGSFKLFTTEMGIASDVSAKMSNSLTNLTLDMASLYNKDFSEVATDLQSGLQGMTKSVRKYGIDVSASGLQETALSLGIAKKVSAMTQAEKAQLRYIQILRQTSLSQGDFARTIQTPANMLKILKDQIKQTAVYLGNLFQPALQTILPVLIKFTFVIQNICKWLATLVGYDASKLKIDTSGIEAGTAAVADNIDSVSKKAKEAKKQLAGFDELNNLTQDTGSSKGSNGGDGSGAPVSFDIPNYESLLSMTDFLPKLREQASQITERFKQWFKPIQDAFSQIDTSPLASLKTSLDDISGTIGKIIQQDFANNWAPGIDKILPSLSSITSSISTLLTVLQPAITTVGGIAWDLISNSLQLIADVLQIITDSVKEFEGPIDSTMETLRTGLDEIFKNLSPGITDLVSELFPILLKMVTSILPPTVKMLTSLSKVVGTVFKILSPILSTILNPLVDVLTVITTVVDAIVSVTASVLNIGLKIISFILTPVIALIKTLTSVTSQIAKVINSTVSSIQNVLTKIFNWIDKKFTSLLNGFNGFINKILGGVEKGINFVLKGLNGIIKWINKIPGFNISELHVSIPKIPKYATGGFPEDGLFFANHNELVGKFTNGTTAVANNDQIIAGIESGVERGFRRAMGNNQAQPINIYLDKDVLYKAVLEKNNEYRRRTGRNAFA